MSNTFSDSQLLFTALLQDLALFASSTTSSPPPIRFFACIINLTSLKHCTLDNAGNLKAIYHLEMMNSDIESKLMWYWMICGNIYLNRWSDFALAWPNLPFCYGCDDWKSFVLLWSTKTICYVKVCCEQRLREYPKGQEKLLTYLLCLIRVEASTDMLQDLQFFDWVSGLGNSNLKLHSLLPYTSVLTTLSRTRQQTIVLLQSLFRRSFLLICNILLTQLMHCS